MDFFFQKYPIMCGIFCCDSGRCSELLFHFTCHQLPGFVRILVEFLTDLTIALIYYNFPKFNA